MLIAALDQQSRAIFEYNTEAPFVMPIFPVFTLHVLNTYEHFALTAYEYDASQASNAALT